MFGRWKRWRGLRGWTNDGADRVVPEHCLTVAYSLNNGVSRTRVRTHATTHSISTQNPTVDALFRFTWSGGAVTMRRFVVGPMNGDVCRPRSPGQRKGDRVRVRVHGLDNLCTIVSWATAGSDLTATIQCFSTAGSPVEGQFNLAIVA